MKQKLGLEYSEKNPATAIVANRLAQLVGYYSETQVLASLTRTNRKTLKPLNHLDYHMINLIETYGRQSVVNTYNLIYNNDNNLNIA